MLGRLFPGLVEWLAALVEQLGYPGIALVAYLDILIPFPSELLMPVAGIPASRGALLFPAVVAAATLGSGLAATTLYAFGRWIGERRIRRVIGRVGQYALLEEEQLDTAFAWFHRHGTKAVLLNQMLPFLPVLVPIPAGSLRMPLAQFIAFATTGALIWNVSLIGLGYWLGRRWEDVVPYAAYIEVAIALLIVGLVGWWIVKQRRATNRRSARP